MEIPKLKELGTKELISLIMGQEEIIKVLKQELQDRDRQIIALMQIAG